MHRSVRECRRARCLVCSRQRRHSKLWNKVAHLVRYFCSSGYQSDKIHISPPSLGLDEITALVELLHHYDDNGDAFRYPVSLDGDWHIDLPPLNLVALGELAQKMADAISCIAWYRDSGYQKATLGCPSPWPVHKINVSPPSDLPTRRRFSKHSWGSTSILVGGRSGAATSKKRTACKCLRSFSFSGSGDPLCFQYIQSFRALRATIRGSTRSLVEVSMATRVQGR